MKQVTEFIQLTVQNDRRPSEMKRLSLEHQKLQEKSQQLQKRLQVKQEAVAQAKQGQQQQGDKLKIIKEVPTPVPKVQAIEIG